MKRTLRMCIIIPSVSPSEPWPRSTPEEGPRLFHPLLSEWSRGRLPLADFPFIHSAGIWLPFPEQRRRFDWLRAGPGWYLSSHTLGLIHVKQARPVNSLITELQHFITQRTKSLAGERAEDGAKRGLNTFASIHPKGDWWIYLCGYMILTHGWCGSPGLE